MKIRRFRFDAPITVVKTSGAPAAIPAAIAPAAACTAFQSSFGVTGTTTCTPLPPVVLANPTSPRRSSSPRTCTAASTTSRQATPSPGSRSKTTRSARSRFATSQPQVWNSTTPNCASARYPAADATVR